MGKRREEAQTKESARRDKRPSPGYCVAICFYYAALGHMFLLVGCGPGARPYVSIMFVLVGCARGARPYVSIACVCMCICVCVCMCVCVTICFHRLAPSQGRNLLAL